MGRASFSKGSAVELVQSTGLTTTLYDKITLMSRITKNRMKGIQFLLNDSGEKTSVLIDLEQWGDLWEDFYDVMLSQSRQDEDEIDWESLEAEIPQAAKSANVSHQI